MTRRYRGVWTVFRAVAVLFTVAVFTQPVLAGALLAGHYDMLRMHRVNGFAVAGLAATAAVVACAGWLMKTMPAKAIGPAAIMAAAATVQILLGLHRKLIVHVPLGVLMTAGAVRLLRVTPAAPGLAADQQQAGLRR